jgi:hypothetical protein
MPEELEQKLGQRFFVSIAAPFEFLNIVREL